MHTGTELQKQHKKTTKKKTREPAEPTARTLWDVAFMLNLYLNLPKPIRLYGPHKLDNGVCNNKNVHRRRVWLGYSSRPKRLHREYILHACIRLYAPVWLNASTRASLHRQT